MDPRTEPQPALGWIPARFNVAFSTAPRPAPWSSWCRKGYQHVWAFAPIDSTFWLVLDPGWFEMRVRIIDRDALDAKIAECRDLSVLDVPRGAKAAVRFRLLPTCVSFIAYLVGHRRFAVTPHRLARQLLAAGATRIF